MPTAPVVVQGGQNIANPTPIVQKTAPQNPISEPKIPTSKQPIAPVIEKPAQQLPATQQQPKTDIKPTEVQPQPEKTTPMKIKEEPKTEKMDQNQAPQNEKSEPQDPNKQGGILNLKLPSSKRDIQPSRIANRQPPTQQMYAGPVSQKSAPPTKQQIGSTPTPNQIQAIPPTVTNPVVNHGLNPTTEIPTKAENPVNQNGLRPTADVNPIQSANKPVVSAPKPAVAQQNVNKPEIKNPLTQEVQNSSAPGKDQIPQNLKSEPKTNFKPISGRSLALPSSKRDIYPNTHVHKQPLSKPLTGSTGVVPPNQPVAQNNTNPADLKSLNFDAPVTGGQGISKPTPSYQKSEPQVLPGSQNMPNYKQPDLNKPTDGVTPLDQPKHTPVIAGQIDGVNPLNQPKPTTVAPGKIDGVNPLKNPESTNKVATPVENTLKNQQNGIPQTTVKDPAENDNMKNEPKEAPQNKNSQPQEQNNPNPGALNIILPRSKFDIYLSCIEKKQLVTQHLHVGKVSQASIPPSLNNGSIPTNNANIPQANISNLGNNATVNAPNAPNAGISSNPIGGDKPNMNMPDQTIKAPITISEQTEVKMAQDPTMQNNLNYKSDAPTNPKVTPNTMEAQQIPNVDGNLKTVDVVKPEDLNTDNIPSTDVNQGGWKPVKVDQYSNPSGNDKQDPQTNQNQEPQDPNSGYVNVKLPRSDRTHSVHCHDNLRSKPLTNMSGQYKSKTLEAREAVVAAGDMELQEDQDFIGQKQNISNCVRKSTEFRLSSHKSIAFNRGNGTKRSSNKFRIWNKSNLSSSSNSLIYSTYSKSKNNIDKLSNQMDQKKVNKQLKRQQGNMQGRISANFFKKLSKISSQSNGLN